MMSVADPTVSADELVIVFSNASDMFYATRTTASDPFGAPVPLAQLNTAVIENDPELSSEGCELYFRSPRVSISDIYVATVQ
jgi:hypothetical protein